jgi:hypothetical protein
LKGLFQESRIIPALLHIAEVKVGGNRNKPLKKKKRFKNRLLGLSAQAKKCGFYLLMYMTVIWDAC